MFFGKHQEYIIYVNYQSEIIITSNIFENKVLKRLKPDPIKLNAIIMSHNKKFIAYGGESKMLGIFDLTDMESERKISFEFSIHHICMSPVNPYLAIGSDNEARIIKIVNL